MSPGTVVFVIICTAIVSPFVCFMVYMTIKAVEDRKRSQRKQDVIEAIKNDRLTRMAIVELIAEEMGKDWNLKSAVGSIPKKVG